MIVESKEMWYVKWFLYMGIFKQKLTIYSELDTVTELVILIRAFYSSFLRIQNVFYKENGFRILKI